MTTFLDGPARGQTLMLRFAPQTLRVVVDSKGKWDALDLPEDTPRPDETVYLYERVGEAAMCHLNAGKRSGFYAIAQYEICHHFVTENNDNEITQKKARSCGFESRWPPQA